MFLAPSREATAISFLKRMQKGKNQVHINLWNDWDSPYEKKLREIFTPLGKIELLEFDTDENIIRSRRILRERKYDCAILHGGDIKEIIKRIKSLDLGYYINWIANNSILFASQNAVNVLMELEIVKTIRYLEHWNIYEKDPERYDVRVHGYPIHQEIHIEEYIINLEGDLYLTCDYSYFVQQRGRLKAFGRMYWRRDGLWYKIDCRGRTGLIDTPFTR